ncbi:hypothetical protein Q7O44_09035 [Shigella flexneri]|nr:hypothetical protein [Shigella flexneri]
MPASVGIAIASPLCIRTTFNGQHSLSALRRGFLKGGHQPCLTSVAITTGQPERDFSRLIIPINDICGGPSTSLRIDLLAVLCQHALIVAKRSANDDRLIMGKLVLLQKKANPSKEQNPDYPFQRKSFTGKSGSK